MSMGSDSTRPSWPFQSITTMTPHPGGQWVKKIHGKSRYFGAWAVPDPGDEKAKVALQRFLEFMRHADNPADTKGQSTVRAIQPQDLTINEVVNSFVTEKHKSTERGELSARQFIEYRNLGELILKVLGKDRRIADLTPADFGTLRSRLPGGPVRMGNEIVWCRSIFRWATDNYAIPIRYGSQFDKPSRRLVRGATTPKTPFRAEEIRAVLDKANPTVKAMVLLGINCAFGQTDCATLSATAMKADIGVLDFERHKTGVRRVAPLWPETVQALCGYTRLSPEHPELFFVTRWGNPWVHDEVHLDKYDTAKTVVRCDGVKTEFDKAQVAAGMKPRGFYLLRHTFRTIADETCDTNAIRCIMGHAFPGMDEFYLHLHGTSTDRLRRVSDHVREWLFGISRKAAKRQKAKKGDGS